MSNIDWLECIPQEEPGNDSIGSRRYGKPPRFHDVAREGSLTQEGRPLSKSRQEVPSPTPEVEPRLRPSSLDSSIPSGTHARAEPEPGSCCPQHRSDMHSLARTPGMARGVAAGTL